MRKLILSMNLTLDGFMAGPDCELDWHFDRWTTEMAESLCEELNKVDTILLGRVTYSAMARYWPQKARDPSFPREDIAFASMMNNYKKVVFSKTLPSATWNNSTLVRGDIMKEVLLLKEQPGKNMIIYGSGRLASSLMRMGLIDEYRLWIHPVILGKGKPLFRDLRDKLELKLTEARTFGSGVIVLYYTMADKMTLMEKYKLDTDIKVFCVTASSFPEGILGAHNKLHSILPSADHRSFYGISYPDKGKIIYKAAVSESYPGEGEERGLETFVIPKGEYISELLTGWKKNETVIGETFRKLLQHPHIDENGFCLEVYEGDNNMRCMVRVVA